MTWVSRMSINLVAILANLSSLSASLTASVSSFFRSVRDRKDLATLNW